MRRPHNPRALWIIAFGLLVGCSMHDVREEAPPPLALPQAFASPSGKAQGPDRWWESFGDPELNGIIERALLRNFDLRIAWTRLDQAQAIARQAGAGWWPRVSASGDASRSQRFMSLGSFGNTSITQNSYSLGVAASYELDVWGKVRSRSAAAGKDLDATRQDLEAIAISLSAQVAETWFSLIEARAQERLLRDQLKVNETYLQFVERRFGSGLASALDILQQKQQLAATKAQLPNIAANTAALEHQLALLLAEAPGQALPGRQPGDGARLPDVPPLPKVGIPSRTLQRRPDLRSAQLRVAAADHRIAAAIADRFPAIGLSGNAGFSATNVTALFENFVYSIAGSISATLWDGGRLSAEVERTKAVAEERVLSYGKAVLLALKEVEDALVRERYQGETLNELVTQLSIARMTLNEARARYQSGLSDYLPVLTSLATLQQLERSEVSARRQVLSYRVQLCRALGGSWTGDLARPPAAADEAGDPDDPPAETSSTRPGAASAPTEDPS